MADLEPKINGLAQINESTPILKPEGKDKVGVQSINFALLV